MTTFYKEVDKCNKQAMIKFLRGHFRYFTGNSCNLSESYAHNVKFYNIGIPKDLEELLWDDSIREMFCMTTFLDIINEFKTTHEGYTIGFNGRSSGYLVLYNDVYPYRGIDDDVCFADLSVSELREKVSLVQDFDKFCDRIVNCFIYELRWYKEEKETEAEEMSNAELSIEPY